MKKFEFGFYSRSGEFFMAREYGFTDGKKLYVNAERGITAFAKFCENIDTFYIYNRMTVREVPAGADMSEYINIESEEIHNE